MKRTRKYVDEAFSQIASKPGVTDIIIINKAGNPIKSSMDRQTAIEYAGMFEPLLQKVQYFIQQLDPLDNVVNFRVRTKYNETIVVPDGKITHIVVQNAKDMFQILED